MLGAIKSFASTRNLIAAGALAAAVGSTMAAPVQYTFGTSQSPFGFGEVVALLGATANVQGSFRFDAATAFTGGSGALGFEPGFAVYGGAVTYLQGTIGSFGFADPYVSASTKSGVPGSGDVLTVTADPTPKAGSQQVPSDHPRQLLGFTVGGYQLSNVRLFWSADIPGGADFLNGYALPGALPTFRGRLALDFVPVSDPLNAGGAAYYSRTVFFDGLVAQAVPVPEPETWALMVAGLGLLGWAARRRA